jgi:phosphoglycerate dehydrogenase-like enzyme
VPYNRETHHLVGEKELRAMKPTAYLVNCCRGAVVDEAALVRALEERWIAGAGLDVFETEPLDPQSPLLRLDNVVTTPHAAGESTESGALSARVASRRAPPSSAASGRAAW